MAYSSYWQGALLLALVPLVHWIALKRTVAVSGRYTVLVNRARNKAAPDLEMSQEELLEALRAETAAAFGPHALENVAEIPAEKPAETQTSERSLSHVLFLVGLGVGGLVSATAAGNWSASLSMRGSLFGQFFGSWPLASTAILFVGGVLVGFGTRMTGGCTSGHALCGISQRQKGSLLATLSFFGSGVITSFVLGAVL